MGILKQILAKQKAFDVIASCESKVHCDGAERYIKRYFEKFEDVLGFRELERALQEHKVSLLGY